MININTPMEVTDVDKLCDYLIKNLKPFDYVRTEVNNGISISPRELIFNFSKSNGLNAWVAWYSIRYGEKTILQLNLGVTIRDLPSPDKVWEDIYKNVIAKNFHPMGIDKKESSGINGGKTFYRNGLRIMSLQELEKSIKMIHKMNEYFKRMGRSSSSMRKRV